MQLKVFTTRIRASQYFLDPVQNRALSRFVQVEAVYLESHTVVNYLLLILSLTLYQGYLTMCGIEDSLKSSCTEIPRDLLEGKKTSFWKDICNFAKVGLEISTTVHGPQHSETVNWRKRKEDPVEFSRNKMKTKQDSPD